MYKKAYGSQLWYCWYFFSRCCPAKLRINDAGKVTETIGRHNHDPPTCWMTPDGKSYNLPPLPAGGDVVVCVPTKKGHQIVYKEYTYVFKDDDKLPVWVSIYFTENDNKDHKCNVCEEEIKTKRKSMLLDHIKNSHEEVYNLHKNNPDGSMGYRIEFLQLNILKDDGDPKTQPVILGEVCEATTEEIANIVPHRAEEDDIPYILIPSKNKSSKAKKDREYTRKRSWIWKYFDKLSNIIFRCNICKVVLSIKGCNTNNMNRHMRTRHPTIYKSEVADKRGSTDNVTELGEEVEAPFSVKVEEIDVSDKDIDVSLVESSKTKSPRPRSWSWVWTYFDPVSGTSAQCKLCNRNICHGGNATGNMNRHIRMLHKDVFFQYITDLEKSAGDNTWVWKVFANDEDDFYTCKICQYRCLKFENINKSVTIILHHLKTEHKVISGDQIITSSDCDLGNIVVA